MKRNKIISAALLLLSAVHSPCRGEVEGGFSLDQCIAMARQNNRTLLGAALDILSAKEQQQEAYTKYFPQVKANVTAFRAFDKMVKGDLTALMRQPLTLEELDRGYGATVSITEPLYAGGQITAANKLSDLTADINALQHSLTEKDVVQKVTENYWQIAQIKYNLRTIEAAERQMDAVCQDVNNFVTAGVTTRNALLKVKMRQKELESNRLKLENADHVLRMLLAQQIGAQGTIDIALPASHDAVQPRHADTADAVQGREELSLAQKNVEAHRLQVKMERAKHLPTLAVGVMGYHTGLGGLSDLAKSCIESTTTNGVALATLSIPLSDWWGGTHAVRRAKNRATQAHNDYLDAQEKLAIDIESSWSNLAEAYQQIDLARAMGDEAAENLRMSLAHYKAGTETLSDLLDAETLNRQAQDSLAAAIATYHIRLADYQRKTGK